MKKIHSMVASLLFAGTTLMAQNLPCSTFEDPSPQGNWVNQYCSDTYGNNDSWDGSQCVKLNDQSGPSWYINYTDYKDIGQNYLGKCLCFDYYLVDDGDPYASNPINPTIYVSDGINTIGFVANVTVYEGTTGWVHICAPIEHCTSSTLPSNADGQWVNFGPSTSCTDFNSTLDNSTQVQFPTDFTSYQTEEMWIDNVCIKDCRNCHTDFIFKPVFNTETGFVYADVFLITTDPGVTYKVDWGDVSVTGLYVSHVYALPGTYNVCVTEYNEQDIAICTTCFKFCYGEATHEYYGDGGQGRAPQVAPTSNGLIKSMLNKTFVEQDRFAIFPNPAKDYVQVVLPVSKKDNAIIRVIDIFGKVVSETNVKANESTRNLKINTDKLVTGIYTVEVTTGGKVSTQKLSVTK